MFVRDPFDVAPGARRHTGASWFILLLGLVLLVAGASFLYRGFLAARHAETSQRTANDRLRQQAEKHAAARLKASDPASLKRIKEQQKLQYVLRMSWSSLFEALESAGRVVDGRASIVALAPIKVQGSGAEIGITALAVSNQVLLEYVKALQTHPHVREVRLSSQHPALSGTASVVRFQLSLLWEPHVDAVAPNSRATLR